MWKSFLRKADGASLVEESLVIGLMAVAATVILTSIASFTAASWREAQDSLVASASRTAAANPSGEGADAGEGAAAGESDGSAPGYSPDAPQDAPGSGQSGSDDGQGLGGQTGKFEFDTD